MANELIQLIQQPKGFITYNNRENASFSLIKDRYPYGGAGYIAGILPGVVTVDGNPAQRPVELRLRELHRTLIERQYSNPINGTYRFNDLDPYLKFDLISRDEPNKVYNDVIVGDIWPWTDYELIFHGLPAPTSFDYSFSRTYEITGGTRPYSISSSSSIPSSVTVDLTDNVLTISSSSDPSDILNLIIEDSSTLTKSIQITSTLADPHLYYRVNVLINDGGGGAITMTELEFVDRFGSNIAVDGTAFAQSEFTGNEATYAFDGVKNNDEFWMTASPSPQYIGYQLLTPKTAHEVRITSRQSSLDTSPRDFVVQTSDDGTTWHDKFNVYYQTSWTSNQTRSFKLSDPNIANVVAVMNPDTSDNATAMTDIKGRSYTFSDTKVSNADGSGFSKAYLEFTGTNGYVVTDSNSSLGILNSGDFTLEAWVIFDTLPSGTYGYGIIGSNNNLSDGFQLRLSSTGIECVYPGLAGTTYNVTWETGKMYHIYWSRAGTQHYAGVNGVGSTISLSNRTTAGSTIVRLGAQAYGGGWIGKMSHRVTSGLARYTGNYQLPTVPFPIFNLDI